MTEEKYFIIERNGIEYIMYRPKNEDEDFMEYLGDALTPNEVVDLLNAKDEVIDYLREENKKMKRLCGID